MSKKGKRLTVDEILDALVDASPFIELSEGKHMDTKTKKKKVESLLFVIRACLDDIERYANIYSPTSFHIRNLVLVFDIVNKVRRGFLSYVRKRDRSIDADRFEQDDDRE
jgi:hypothetical protein